MGGTLSIPVAPGNRHVELITSQGKSGVATIACGSGETTVTVKLSQLTGAPKLS